MSPERQNFSQIEKELHFSKWTRDKEIDIFLFDLDDTICATGKVFQKFVPMGINFLATNNPIISPEEWQKEVITTDNKLFEKLGVNPNRWSYLMEEINEKYDLKPEVYREAREIFSQIYKTPLKMLDGSKEALNFFKKIDMPIAIVTHANKDWTHQKYKWLGLDEFVDFDNDIYVINENGHKTSESWQEALNYFKISAKQCAVVGDSPRSDVNPATEIGVKQCFLIENPNIWSVHDQPVHPSTIRIKNLSDLIELGTNIL